MQNKKLSKDLNLVREKLKSILQETEDKKMSLKRANTMIYACSNITRAVIAEIYLNKSEDDKN